MLIPSRRANSRERHLRLYGHVARLPAENPIRQMPSCRELKLEQAEGTPACFVDASSEGYGPGVCPGDGQTEAYLKDIGMAGLEDGRRNIVASWARRHAALAYVPILDLTTSRFSKDLVYNVLQQSLRCLVSSYPHDSLANMPRQCSSSFGSSSK